MIFLLAFLGAITPGPDILLVIRVALRSGLKPALATLGGIFTGWCLWLSILYFGFSSVMQGDLAQILLSIFGGFYLLYLSYFLMNSSVNVDFSQRQSGGYTQGFIVNISNPKAIMFFSILIVPYMEREILLNLSLLLCGLTSGFLTAIFIALYFRRWLTNAVFVAIDRICGIVFVGFAIVLFWSAFKKFGGF